MGPHAVHCPRDAGSSHELVRIRVLDGRLYAEVQMPAPGSDRPRTVPHLVGRTDVDGPHVVVVACPCGEFLFDVGRYLAGEWVEPEEHRKD